MKRFFKLHHWLVAVLIGMCSISVMAATSHGEQLCMDRLNKICGKVAYYADYAKCVERLYEHSDIFPCKNTLFSDKKPPKLRVQFTDPLPFLSQYCQQALNQACSNKRYLSHWRGYLKCVSLNVVLRDKCFQRQVATCSPAIIITIYRP